MKAGLIYEIESIKPHAADHEYRVFWETMEQIELADRLGFDSVWTVEHHFLNEFSYCSAPEVFLACVTQRTKQIRVGHGVVVLPFNHPIHVAERIAMLDIMSNGRVEFGTGRATTMDELLGFGVRPEDTRPRWAEAVEAIPRMWREDPFTMHGKYWTVEPPVSVIPKPIQKPHPPMWVAATNPTTFELAAERGLGVLCFTLGVELAQVSERINIYRAGIKHARPVGQTINNQVSMNIMGLIGDDPYEAEHIAREAVLWYVRKGFELVSSVAAASKTDESYKYLKTASKFDPAKFTTDYYDFLKDGDLIAVGAVDEAVRVAKRYCELGADQVLFFLQYGGIPHEKIMKSIDLIGHQALGEIHSWKTPGGITGC
ncbi:MAG: LLM class flavin-dependent oxidoreductase [Candidatus Binatus sp.]|uniref:LLM class flavin-dependent oxidoreductase n=1 Tax=Candidatus Binatus sp. TaxID=2811406 RepID=UPI003CA35C8F